MTKKNRGTFEGDSQEKQFVIDFNKEKYKNFINQFFPQFKYIYCVNCSTNQYSETSKHNVKPKSDAFLIETQNSISQVLIENNYYLNEEIIKIIDFQPVQKSGISIKLKDSKDYQIHKFTVDSFIKVFKDRLLGCGAMIYCMRKDEIVKNVKIFDIWKVDQEEFIDFFKNEITSKNYSLNDLDFLKEIKAYSNNAIVNSINSDSAIKNLIFTGLGVFQDPYYATFSFIDDNLEPYKFPDFYVTTGSGRLKTPTIVIKPK